ncbi:SLC13 family permease [Mobilicoccus pelagius]|uniref:Sodium-dependent dicarboxylate transporter SdcS n=1 Tax=Mobilicoccus pelagius NBRC 104925 TaxID=1089455 RepID=H5UV64_9MICO|nr:DASS family sodium-coupled anion symporter [Mobilicoccus pelagius]GAB49622.1 putative DASS family transporter [Mobilicoccus pelagius NBRC 104925]
MSHQFVPGAHLRGLEADPHRGEEIEKKSPGERAPAVEHRTHRLQLTGLAAGLLAAALVYVLMPGDVPADARLTAATAVLMGLWWMTEAVPIPATALLPLVVFPLFASDVSVNDVGASYGNNIIFLFMGGFFLALAMQRWNLHRRIALVTVRLMGTSSSLVIAGFMIATGFLSMWVSNTATAVMMLPIGVSVLMLVAGLDADAADPDHEADAASAPDADADPATDAGADPATDAAVEEATRTNFGTALMLGIAYSASLGSLGTLIGTPPNTLLAGFMDQTYGVRIDFFRWMMVGVPLAVVFLVVCWFLLTHVLFRPETARIAGGRELFDTELEKLGPTSSGERRVLAIFVLAATAWVALPLVSEFVLGLKSSLVSDAGIAIIVGLLLFLLPSGSARGVRLLDWDTAVSLPWGVLLLFGGGLALSEQFTSSGLTKWIGGQVSALGALPVVALMAIIAAGVLFLTELTSNTATAATFLPVAGGVATGLGIDPMLLAVPVALSATCAFMLPVATPPNAIAYGSGYVSVGQMVKGGLLLNLIGIVLVTLTASTLLVWAFGITL